MIAVKQYWDNLNLGLVKVSGPDARDFLQRLTCQEMRLLREGQSVGSALLTSTSQVVSLFNVLLDQKNFYLLTASEELAQSLGENLEKLHFAEDLLIEDVSKQHRFIVTLGDELNIKRTFFSQRSFKVFFFNQGESVDECEIALKNLDYRKMTRSEFDYWYAFQGLARWGVDFGENNLILEGAYDDYLSRTKGCYPGQEVVERVFTYGNVAKRLVSLKGSQKDLLNLKSGSKLFSSEKEVGVVTSVVVNPSGPQVVAFAMVKKPHFEPQEKLTSDGMGFEVELLPHTFDIPKEKNLIS